MPSVTVKGHKITYTVTKVTIDETDSSVKKFDKPATKDMQDMVNQVLAGAKHKDKWTADFAVDEKKHEVLRATGLGYPLVDGHPGHTHNSTPGAWKYNIERSTTTVNRLVLDTWKAEIKDQKYKLAGSSHEITLNLEISCKARVLKDTH